MTQINLIIYALLGGILPALIWLFFWLREDSYHPEPISLIFKTFITGSLAVIMVLPYQQLIGSIFPGMSIVTFLLWAILEESFKFGAAYFVAIRNRENNEPLDPMIYMIVAALGFVALENALFIISPLLQSDIADGVLTGNLRFIGASLLHIVSSSVIGSALALNFYKSKKEKILWSVFAFIIAVAIHTTYNLFIIDQNGLGMFLTFGAVWAGITLLILMFERVKMIVSPDIKTNFEKVSTENTSPQD